MIAIHLPDGSIRRLDSAIVVGRAPEREGCVPVVLDDPVRSVSKSHAVIRPTRGVSVEVTDLGATNGTTVERQGITVELVSGTPTEFATPIQLACGEFVLTLAPAEEPDGPAGATVPRLPSLPLAAPRGTSSNLPPSSPPRPTTTIPDLPAVPPAPTPPPSAPPRTTTTVPPSTDPAARSALIVRQLVLETSGRRRLDRVDLDAKAGEMIAVLGTSGAGKSTLIKAIAGVDPASSGTVLVDGVDVYRDFDSLRHRIGYVPQDDILHPTLTVRETLRFAARLRLPDDVGPDERESRVAAVLDELGLVARADARVNELSGGQRKRVNVAVELITSPSLLILDEPTSGLDPGNERISMELFRSLASGDRVVLVVTHSTDSLGLCDRVILMGAGGIKVYDGHIDQMSTHFGGRSINEIFAHLERSADIDSLRTPALAPLALTDVAPASVPTPLVERIRNADLARIGHQFHILAERYIRVIESDRRNSIVLAAQAAVIAVLMLAVFATDSFEPSPGPSKAGNVLMALALASIYLGASNAIREIVKERPMLQREMALGISPVAYLGSKIVPLGAFTILQSMLLIVVGTLRQGQPTGAATFLPAMTEIFVIVATSGVSAVCLGLVLSAVSPSADRAMTVLPVVLFSQLLLVGLIFPVSTPGVQQLAWLTSAFWSFGGAASTADFDALYCAVNADADCVWLWSRSAINWLASMTALCALGLGSLFWAWRSIDRSDPARVLERR